MSQSTVANNCPTCGLQSIAIVSENRLCSNHHTWKKEQKLTTKPKIDNSFGSQLRELTKLSRIEEERLREEEEEKKRKDPEFIKLIELLQYGCVVSAKEGNTSYYHPYGLDMYQQFKELIIEQFQGCNVIYKNGIRIEW